VIGVTLTREANATPWRTRAAHPAGVGSASPDRRGPAAPPGPAPTGSSFR